MKDYKELINRFYNIPDFPISEEVLGAYLEGNATPEEISLVELLLASDETLSDSVDLASNLIDEWESDLGRELYEGDYDFEDLDLPPILSPIDLLLEDNKEDVDVFSVGGDRNQPQETHSLQNVEMILSDNTYNSSIMANKGNTIIYGEAGENISDPIFVQQPDDHSCALRSQQIILRDFGIDIPFKDLEQIALDYKIYTNEGTYTYDIGKVLQLAGVGMHQTIGNSVDDLINELAQGHRVIVSVDANELWYNKTIGDKMKNWFEDAIGRQGGNHALIVAGIEVNPMNPKNNKVILTDPGAGHLRIEYPMEQFKEAWGDSNCFMAATNDSAPYQYDATTGMEIPSNFAVQQYVNDFVANNSYQLSPDMINIPQDYQPAFVGHLDVVGDVDYDMFKANYDAMVENRIPSSLSVKEQIEEVFKLHEEPASHNNNSINNISCSPYIESTELQGDVPDNPNQSPFRTECQDDDSEETDDESNPIKNNMTICHEDELCEEEGEDSEDDDDDGDEE